jgi:hypothetical protein
MFVSPQFISALNYRRRGRYLSEKSIAGINKQKRPLRALCFYITKTGGVNKQRYRRAKQPIVLHAAEQPKAQVYFLKFKLLHDYVKDIILHYSTIMLFNSLTYF